MPLPDWKPNIAVNGSRVNKPKAKAFRSARAERAALRSAKANAADEDQGAPAQGCCATCRRGCSRLFLLGLALMVFRRIPESYRKVDGASEALMSAHGMVVRMAGDASETLYSNITAMVSNIDDVVGANLTASMRAAMAMVQAQALQGAEEQQPDQQLGAAEEDMDEELGSRAAQELPQPQGSLPGSSPQGSSRQRHPWGGGRRPQNTSWSNGQFSAVSITAKGGSRRSSKPAVGEAEDPGGGSAEGLGRRSRSGAQPPMPFKGSTQALARVAGKLPPAAAPVGGPGAGRDAPELFEGLWSHLQTFVLSHRQRLGPIDTLVVLGSAADKAVLQKAFASLAMPPGASLTQIGGQRGATRVFLQASCGGLAALGPIWGGLMPGSLLALRVCSAAEYAEAQRYLYNLNCDIMAMTAKAHCDEEQSPQQEQQQQQQQAAPLQQLRGKRLSCEDFPLRNLRRVGFVPGFLILEKRDKPKSHEALGSGEFLVAAKETADSAGEVRYQELYERYLTSKRHLQGSMLGIGMGCTPQHGQGRLPSLWRRYFKDFRIEFLEEDELCAGSSAHVMDAHDISEIHVGEALRKTEEIAAQINGPGYDVVVDDGRHSNGAVVGSLDHLWPVVAKGGYYVMEGIATASFELPGCEPLQSADQQQQRTALAKVLRAARPLVLANGRSRDLASVECVPNACLLQKKP